VNTQSHVFYDLYRTSETSSVLTWKLLDCCQSGRQAEAGKRKYADSIESLVRNNIQKTKIDMANEVIDAGRFNMATTQEERKETLEALLQASTLTPTPHVTPKWTRAMSCPMRD
jgi:hypothetical protein